MLQLTTLEHSRAGRDDMSDRLNRPPKIGNLRGKFR
jgi:hypothetical protein